MSNDTPWQVKVTGYDILTDENGKQYVAYKHEASKGDQKSVIISRFSRFEKLDAEVHRAFKGNHLESNIPHLPAKQLKFLVDHLSTEFIEERKDDLERYLQIMARLPGINKVQAWTDFLTTNSPLQRQLESPK